ncbi:hypothetical protein TWF569_002293 [Orbilia oligospora]|uniref:Threonylcarbamoyl-AMP synthase n=1 Tax=Orbilia oligospora TaxID=2813651 RepID=A0A7C8NGD3_ORBOL|nr:hypothetical protein TWF102_000483 [Orbilia oligospora]KAF3084047.1 hypothetical protein TWF102_000483 [Orbilia oligospora]KAF3097127.1 hypothetical protein TWF103_009648 [Orbilia oligospora]KAF3117072.1 hypothetical protein TWF706_000279 [Orbilia oligospora]KAF3117073.1 hypothetical protein TWF706_000279 [Orbilia oligospora]
MTSPSSEPVSPPAMSSSRITFPHRITKTEVLSINPSDVKFELSADPSVHPYEDPTFTTSSSSQTGKAILLAAERLRSSDVPVAFPTETVYGLGADATRDEAVRNIFTIKGRPADNPLIVHIGSLKQARELLRPANASPAETFEIPAIYKPLIDKFWPGPLTILLPLPLNSKLSPHVYATQTTVGVRMPAHPVALALALASNLPIAAPSANKSGLPSPTTAKHVAVDLYKRVELILDGGSCNVGLESTVVDGLSSPPAILRPGGVSLEQIRECEGWEGVIVHKEDGGGNSGGGANGAASGAAPRAPGMKYKHYSPTCGVRLYLPNTDQPSVEMLKSTAFGSDSRVARLGVLRTRQWKELDDKQVEWLRERNVELVEESLGTSGEEISRKLFGALRRMDDEGVVVVHIEGIEEDMEGLAVMNRLKKAASVVIRRRDV